MISTTTDVTLRPYQIDCLNVIHDREAAGVRRLLISTPTGTGKTILFCQLIADRADGRALILVHRRELIDQTINKLQAVGVDDIGVIQADRNELDHRVLVASVQTLARQKRLDQLPDDIDLVIVDECHHATAETWERVIAHTMRDDTLLLGFSATPERHGAKAEKRHLADLFDEISFQYPIHEAIADGWLVPPRGVRVSLDVDLDSLDKIGGDFTNKAIEDAMTQAKAPSQIVEAYIDHAHERCTVAFCATVNAARELRDAFRDWGITSETLYGELSADVRAQLLADHAARKFEVLTSVGVLTEGVDVPAWDCCIFARPTLSRSLYIQCVGRVLRPFPGKTDALVLDCVGVTERHKLVTVTELIKPEPVVEAVKEREGTAGCVPGDEISGELVTEHVDLFAGSPYHWVAIPPDAWALNLAKLGVHLVVPGVDEFSLIRNGYPGPVEVVATSPSVATLKRQAEQIAHNNALGPLVTRGGTWRYRRVTPGRAAFAEKWGIDPREFNDDGALADAITVVLSRSTLGRRR